ncbi:MAG: DegT/DnrJ/EryC1/StrS family aminotransferase [Armatimonadota bacterium]
MSKLAIDGGTPVRNKPLPSVNDISGRSLGDEEISNLTDVIHSGKLFRYGGKYVQQFEQKFAAKLGVRYALGCTSGTAAVHITLGALNPDAGSEVITAPITDMGTIAPILFQNCIPIFADLDPYYYTMLPESIESRITKKTAAIIVVHLFGQPCDMDAILEISRRHNIPVIEDCCQAYMTEYKGKLVGTMGAMGAFSLQQSKHMTAGDGGAVVTDNEELASRAALFSDKGWPRGGEVRDYLFLGTNYRMNELTGAVAAAQVGKVEEIVEHRRKVAELLTQLISDIPGVNPPKQRSGCKHSWWLYPITIEEELLRTSPKNFAHALTAEGIPAGQGYIGRPIYMSPLFQERATYGKSGCPFSCKFYGRDIRYSPEDCPNTMEILRRIITIPCNEFFAEDDVRDIARAIEKVASAYSMS